MTQWHIKSISVWYKIRMNIKQKLRKNPFMSIGAGIFALILIIIGIRSITRTTTTTEEEATVVAQKTEVVALRRSLLDNNAFLEFQALVQAENETTISAESSGKVTQVYKKEGATVSKGEALFALNNQDQQIAYQQSVVLLDNQKLILQNLQDEFSAEGSSVQGSLSSQQELAVKNAYQVLLNNDLQAYPADDPETQRGGAPVVSGTYQSTQEGSYMIEVYSSGTNSGASFRYSGLEHGTGTVSTSFAVPLGTRGLMLTFPEGFGKNEDWVVSLPNKNSSSYVQSLNSYQTALQGKETNLKKSAVTQEQLQQQQNTVRQQELSVAQAQERLEKTIVRAPFDGDLIDFDITVGSVVSAFAPAGSIKSLGDLELEFSLSRTDSLYLSEGDDVYRNDTVIGTIDYISRSLDTTNYKNIVRVTLEDTAAITAGETISVLVRPTLSEDQQLLGTQNIIPLTAIKIIGNDPYVGTVSESGNVTFVPVGVGLLLGSQIEISSGLEGANIIIKDARGVSDGDTIDY